MSLLMGSLSSGSAYFWLCGFCHTSARWKAENVVIVVLVTKLCLTLHDRMRRSPPGSSVRGISQSGMLEWVAISFPRSSDPGIEPTSAALADEFFTTEPPGKPPRKRMYMQMCERLIAQSCPALCNPMWPSAHQAPQSMEFSRQEHWSG